MAEATVTKDESSLQLTFERVFNAPRDKVFAAFADSDKLAQWWGPQGWETTNKVMDFRPGGEWLYCMTCVDKNQGEWFGQEAWGKAVYSEIVQPEKIVYTDYFSDETGAANESMPSTSVTLLFTEQDGKTTVTSISQFENKEAYDTVIGMGVIEGFSESWDRLDQLVTSV